MLSANDLRPEMAIRLEGTPFRVVEGEYHRGDAKMGGVTLAHLTNLETGMLGKGADYLIEATVLTVEFLDGRPVGVVFPDIVEATVTETAPPAHTQGNDNDWKPAVLENCARIRVPPFIAPGERVRVEVETGRYVERAHGAQAHGERARAEHRR